MNHQAIIVYRNPAEAMFWDFWGPLIPYVAGIIALILILVLLVAFVKSFFNNRNSNSYYYGGNSNKSNSLADL